MEDNWYETTVSVKQPYNIISVVDWASDSPVPYPPPTKKLATYNVFAWGINDPAEGERSIVTENYDTLASPVGWHTLPYTSDPSYRDYSTRRMTEFYRNTTTTWGNNVCPRSRFALITVLKFYFQVFAQENWDGRGSWIDNLRPDAGPGLKFHYPYDPQTTDKEDALDEAKKYINATLAQLFYTSNMVHDLFYR